MSARENKDRETQLKRRFEIVPQMEKYDALRQHLTPYMCQSNPPNCINDVISTDELGFRVSFFNDKEINSNTWFDYESKSVLLGGSVAFSWGATSNRTALASVLAEQLGMPVQSLGIMAGHSLHEFIAAAPYYPLANNVVSITGTNTFYACVASKKTRFDLYSPLYPFMNVLFEGMQRYDVLTLNYLTSDHIQPNHYFKSPSQRAIFRKNMRARMWRRFKNRMSGQMMSPEIDSPQRSIEDAVEFAIKIQCRDVENMHNASANNKYLCVLQPFLPSLPNKKLSSEELELQEIAEDISRADTYRMLYEVMAQNYDLFITRVEEFCKTKGIPYLNLQKLNYEGWCFVDSSHLTDHGAVLVAKEIAKALNKNV